LVFEAMAPKIALTVPILSFQISRDDKNDKELCTSH